MIDHAQLAEFAVLARMGAEHAGHTLSKWLHREVHIEVSSVETVRLDLIPEEAGEAGESTVTMMSRVEGELPGNAAVQLSYADATALVSCLGGSMPAPGRPGEIGELERSMLQETANILFSSLMNSLACLLGVMAVPYAPAVLVDIGTAAWDGLLLEAAAEADEAVVVTARLACIGSGPKVRLVFLPAPGALGAIRTGAAHVQH
jgi:chemotaxis protein CheY-P-specific phosphatase CheC